MMEKLHLLQPEVGGDWGPKTIVANRPQLQSGEAVVPEVSHLDYQFDVWLGDDLLACHACYIVTERLARALTEAGLTGVQLAEVEISTSENWQYFQRLSPPKVPELPPFHRLVPQGHVHFQTDGKVVSWSGHDVNWGTCVDWVKPAAVHLVATAMPPYGLVVTNRCLALFQKHGLNHCDMEDLTLS